MEKRSAWKGRRLVWLVLAVCAGVGITLKFLSSAALRTSEEAVKALTPKAAGPVQAQSGRWEDLTDPEMDRIDFGRLPPDDGVVAPIADLRLPIPPDIVRWTNHIDEQLPKWPPALVADPVQRARNLLYVAAVPDSNQVSPLENFVPEVVFNHLRAHYPAGHLKRILAWIALHPDEGDLQASTQLTDIFGIEIAPYSPEEVRERVRFYALKFILRLDALR